MADEDQRAHPGGPWLPLTGKDLAIVGIVAIVVAGYVTEQLFREFGFPTGVINIVVVIGIFIALVVCSRSGSGTGPIAKLGDSPACPYFQ